MSIFECVNGHMMSCWDVKCRECGKPVYYMDGVSDEMLELLESKDICVSRGTDERDLSNLPEGEV